ncbi:MAG: hypothetical protein MUC65_09655 [Pontiellaceae bacterium]|jgi:cytoskeletal protein CcmA (bactofilin family)|nr:hypothetical protein [Pontiellaceae bacterium]
MSKVKSQTSKILLAAAAGLLIAQDAAAIGFIQRDQFVSGEAETLRDELWVYATTITISGKALDDIFAAGATLDLRGSFNNDVWACGEQVIAAGRFDDHVRLIANTAQISGTLNSSLTAMGKTVKIDRSATISNSVLCCGENIISEGALGGNIRIVAQTATLGGNIAGDVSITANEIIVLPGTVIGGNLTYTAPNELVLFPSVTLGGKLNRTVITPPPAPIHKPLTGHFLFAVAALCAGLVFSSLFSGYTAKTVALLQTARGACLLTGLAALFIIPIIAFILIFTLVGITISLLLFLFYFILLYLSKIVVGFWLGTLIMRRNDLSKGNRGGLLAAGLFVIYALSAFTAVSMAINLIVILFGLGALLLALFKKPVLIIQTPPPIN